MRFWAGAALAAGCLAAIGMGAAAAPPPTTSLDDQRAGWLADYAQLKGTLEASYSHLAWFASPEGGVDLPALDRRTRQALETASTQAEARTAIRDFVAGLHDGHFSELPELAEPPAVKPAEPPVRAMAGEDPIGGCAALGYGDRSEVYFSLPFESLTGFRLEADGVTSVFRAGVITQGGRKIGIVRIKNFSEKQYPAACLAAWRANPKMDKAGDDFAQAVTDAWLGDLAAQLRAFKAEGVGLVLVDVGSNTGGNDSGDWAARLFTRRDVHSARLLMAADPQAERYLDEQFEGLDAAAKLDAGPATAGSAAAGRSLFEASRAAVAGRRCGMAWAWTERRPYDPAGCSRLVAVGFAGGAQDFLPSTAYGARLAGAKIYWPAVADPWRGAWDGPVYVLTNSATYSAAEMFTAVMKDNGVARTVGTRTGGDGCGFMTEAAPVVLTHVGLRLRVPNCVRLRRDGTDEVAGIEADLPAPPTEGESARARAVKVLTLVTAEAG